MTKTKKLTEQKKSLRLEVVTQMLTLITSGFAVVAALAWNDAIQSSVNEYIVPRFPNAGIWSKFIYAFVITILIVFITYQLSQVRSKFENRDK